MNQHAQVHEVKDQRENHLCQIVVVEAQDDDSLQYSSEEEGINENDGSKSAQLLPIR